MNGFDAIPKLKARWPKTQIIIISSLIDEEIKKQLFKSFDTVDFVEKVGNLEKNVIESVLQAEKILKIHNLYQTASMVLKLDFTFFNVQN